MAQKGINKVTLIGHLGQDPEIRYMPNGNAVANFTLATGETWKDKETGEPRERTEWHRIAMFGKLAEIAGEYLKKGSQVYVEGRNQTRKYTDQSGVERYITEVVVDQRGTMQMMGVRPQGNASHSPSQQQSNTPPASTNTPQYNEPPLDLDDDLPY